MPKIKAYESPLISHARMRAMYRVLVELRLLAAHGRALPAGGEGCWVGAGIGLAEGDLVSAGPYEPLLAHIRLAGQRAASTPANRAQLAAVLDAAKPCYEGTGCDRMMTAAGAAMAQKTANTQAATLAFVGAGELTLAEWSRLARVLSEGLLPLVLVALPAATRTSGAPSLERELRRYRQSLPVVTVDAGDPVGSYRVTQESLGRARSGGGPVLLEALRCGTDPVATLAGQLVRKGICDRRWPAGVQAAAAKRMPSA